MAEKWIQKAIKKPGALHKELGIKEGKKIPAKRLATAGGSSGIVVNPTNTKVLFTNGTSIYEIAGNVNQALFLQVANNLS